MENALEKIKQLDDCTERNVLIEKVAKNIKNIFFTESYKSEHNWKYSVEILQYLSSLKPKIVRNALKFEFSRPKHKIDDYRASLIETLGEDGQYIIDILQKVSDKMKSRHLHKIVLINATFHGGGVAEMMQTAGPILSQFGIELEWHIIYPTTPHFYNITKSIHNSIQGKDIILTDEEMELWDQINKINTNILSDVFKDQTIPRIFIEDPQVAPMIKYAKEINPNAKLSWRLHIDISGIKRKNTGAINIWSKILSYLSKMDNNDVALFQRGHVPDNLIGKEFCTFIQYPGIDILKPKNETMEADELSKRIEYINKECNTTIDIHTPYIVTGARFDYWKGLVPLIRAFEKIADKYPDINLIVFGGYADDDPEGVDYFNLIKFIKQQSPYKDRIQIVYNQVGREIGALYRLAAVNKMPYCAPSIAEGYCLMTDEAAVHGAVPFTTESGGLHRYPKGEWRVDVADIEEGIEDAAHLHTIVDNELVESEQAKALEQRICEKLTYLLDLRYTEKIKYMNLYKESARIAKKMAYKYSLISMLRNYLMLATSYREKFLQLDLNKEIKSVDKLLETY